MFIFAPFQQNPTPPVHPLEKGLKPYDANRVIATEPVQLLIWKAKEPLPSEVLRSLKDIAIKAGATEVYYFAMKLSDGPAHLGLGVSPNNKSLFDKIGKQFQPVWEKFNPDNPVFDILPLDLAPAASAIQAQGIIVLKTKN